MYLYTIVNSINPAFAMGCLFGVTLLICFGSLVGAVLATSKFEFFCCFAILMLTFVCLYLVLETGVLQ